LPRLSDAAELVLYRVAQESLTNVARHAHATRAAVSLTASADAVTLRVTDDGPAGSFHFQEGAGIRGMRERALLVRARLDIGAAPEGGTEVLLRVPTATRGS
ncbi:MAG TPA: ATP-binding protein, partial [Microbacteriaceae bacterium]|nr:ATP-binding protein [Microbacteriaceae bacterium]